MIREPAVAGQFYPGDPKELRRVINGFLERVPYLERQGTVLGLVVPHAGYVYSGQTAAYAYSLIRGAGVRTVVLLGPTHRVPFRGFAIYGKGQWVTPLGRVEIDGEVASELTRQDLGVQDLPETHRYEYSLEVQIPFLQTVLDSFKIVPILFCAPSYEQVLNFSRALVQVCQNRRMLVIASSDLYHGPSSRVCRATDSVTLDLIERLDAQGLFTALETGRASACGGFPVTALMVTMRELGVRRAQVLHRTDSYEVTGQGEGEWVVGYASVAFLSSQSQANQQADEPLLTAEERTELLRIARSTITAAVNGTVVPQFEPLTPRLAERRGVFVTLHKKGELRGCVGYIEGIAPLHQAVRDMALAAATEDYRFPPVKPAELKDIDIEITVLTPLVRSHDPLREIVLGKHGIVVKQGSRHGVFLPQVAIETGWDVETFLRQCCAGKAGLAPDAWRQNDCEVYLFSGQIFGEREM